MEPTPKNSREQLEAMEKAKLLVDRLAEVVRELIDVAELKDDNEPRIRQG